MEIKNVFVLIIAAIYVNQLNLCQELDNLLENERCVFLISDQRNGLDKILFQFMQISTIVNFNLSTFTKNSVKYYCAPTTYILITNNNNDILTIVQNIVLLKVHTKLITVSRGKLEKHELKKLEEICFIRFIQTINIVLEDNHTVKSINITDADKHNLDRKPVRVFLFEYVPYVFKRDGVWQGFEIKILQQIARGMTLEFVPYRNNDWVGEIRDLGNNSADVSVTGHWLSHTITYGGDPTVQYASVTLTFLVPRPRTLPVSTYVFQTLSSTVWAMILISILSYTMLLHLVHKCKKLKGTPTYLINVLSYLSMVPVPLKSKDYLLKIPMVLLAMASVILSTMHSAGLSSIALVPRRFKPIETMSDLADAALECYAITNFLKSLLLESEFASERQVGLNMGVSDVDIPGACQEAVILQDNTLVPIYPEHPDVKQLMLLDDIGHQTYNCFALAKNSPYMMIFNKRLYQLIEHGFVKKWILEKHLRLTPTGKYKGRGLQVSSSEQMLMTIAKLEGAFILLFSGYFLSSAVLLVEFALKIKVFQVNLRSSKK